MWDLLQRRGREGLLIMGGMEGEGKGGYF